ncbi:FtsX-like permease family protein [Clostridium sp. LP20]|uniref:FtsX-like permease family protein n=1 Tax=Clostridium sp. LP20 TaxID=3418665 RepID=UPI003EE7F8FE
MNLFYSIKQRKATTIFFILSFTLSILIFSLGSSATISQNNRAKAFNSDNNKFLVFIHTNNISLSEVVNVFKDEKVTIILEKEINEKGIIVQSIVARNGEEFYLDLKEGGQVFNSSLLSTNNSAIFSTRIKEDELILNSSVENKALTLKKEFSVFDIQKSVILPYETFEQLYDKKDMNQSNVNVIIRGEVNTLSNAVDMLDKYLKSKDENFKLITSPYLSDNKSIEGEALHKATFFVVLITIINSISISSLWVKSRKKEIVLRKVLGAEDKDIAKIFFGELVIIAIASLILALGIQYILAINTNGFISTVDVRLHKGNFISSFMLAIFSAFIVTLPSLKFISKVQPIEMLREE